MSKKPTPSTPDLADALAADLRSVVAKLKRNFRAQSDHHDFTATQIAVLLRLERDGPTAVSNLARAEGIRAQSMGTAIAPLEAAGFIAGAPDPDDGRRTILSLTDACRSWMKVGRDARQDGLSRSIRDKLTPDEQQLLVAAARILNRLVDE